MFNLQMQDMHLRVQLPQIHHPGTDGGNALGLKLRLGRVQVPAHFLHIHIHQQCTVVVGMTLIVVKGVAGEFSPVRQYVVPPGLFRRDAKVAYRFLNHGELLIQIIVLLMHKKREIQV